MMPPDLDEPMVKTAVRRRWPTVAFALTTFVFLARPLLGLGSFLAVDIAELFSPWRWEPQSGQTGLQNVLLGDALDVHQHFASVAADLRAGQFAFWDRSIGAGIPTLKAGLPPFNWIYAIVPAWYAPGLAAALRHLTAAGLTFGLCRRLGLDRDAAVLGGVAYAFCGFMIGWSGWPQGTVAAFLPGLFWFVEALVRRPRLRLAVPFAVLVASMIWSNFPSIMVYGLVFAAGYAVYRMAAERSRGAAAAGELRRWVTAVAIAGWGIVGAIGLASYHILHFGENLRWADNGPRDRLPADTSLGAEYLPSFLFPRPYGASHDGATYWGSEHNYLEIQSYAGLSVVLLALLALAHRTRRRGASGTEARLGGIVRAWWVMVVLAVWLAYVGGPLTAIVNSVPVIGLSTIGRIRTIANLGLAVLAACGLQAWLTGRRDGSGVDLRRGVRDAALAVAALGLVTAPYSWSWFRITRDAGFVKEALAGMLVPGLAAVLCGAVVWWLAARPKRGAWLPTVAITAIVAGELLIALGGFHTIVDRRSADLTTAAHADAIAALEPGERMHGEGRVFFANSGQTTGLDDARGKLFTPPGFRELMRAIDPDHFRPPGGTNNPYFDDVDIASPALDRIGAGLWVADPFTPIVGTRTGEFEGWVSYRVDPAGMPTPHQLAVPLEGIRAIGVDVTTPASGTLTAELRDSEGGTATAVALLGGRIGPRDLVVVEGALEPGSAIVATFRFVGSTEPPWLAGGTSGVMFDVVAADDAMTIVRAGDVIIYDRGRSVGARLAHAAVAVDSVTSADHLGPLDVALVETERAAELGLPTEVPELATGEARVREVGRDELTVDVETSAPALVILPQPDYPGWTATVDGVTVEIVRVDGAFPAVLVPAGQSVVELEFRPTYLRLALTVTILAAVMLAVTWRFGPWIDARREIAAVDG